MTRKLSAGLVLAIVLLLAMAAIGIAATRFGVLDFNYGQAENEEYIAHILTLDETYENEYLTLTINEAVFDGAYLSMTMEIEPKPDCGEGVFVRPRVTAVCGGAPLDVYATTYRGDFHNGFWVPERDMEFGVFDGQYGVEYAVMLRDEEKGLISSPQKDAVTWTVCFEMISPQGELVDDAAISFTTQETNVKVLSQPQTFDLGRYEATVESLSISFGRCDYAISVTKKEKTGKSAGQEYLDRDAYWHFALLANGVRTQLDVSTIGVEVREVSGQAEEAIHYTGTVILSGETDTICFVPCWGKRDEYLQDDVYAAQRPLTPEQEALAFTVKIE